MLVYQRVTGDWRNSKNTEMSQREVQGLGIGTEMGTAWRIMSFEIGFKP